jgi:hypothetical protein
MENARIGDKFYTHETNENILVGGLKSCSLKQHVPGSNSAKAISGDGMLWTSGCETRVVTLDHHYAPFNTLPSLERETSRITLHTLANN